MDVTTRVPPPAGTHVTHWSDRAFDFAADLAREGVALARTAAPDVPTYPVVDCGSPAQVLVHASPAADLVVVGTHGRGDLAALCHGSVSAAVMAHARCPAVVVPRDTPMPGPEHDVVVGVDGSASSWWALEAAADVAALAGTGLRVVSAWTRSADDEWLSAFPAPSSVHSSALPRTAAEAARGAAAMARRRVADRHPGLMVTEVVVEGAPATVLAEQSLASGLLVVGTHGWGPVRSLLLGSVSHGVVHTASCPVEVVRPPTRVPDHHRAPEFYPHA